MTAVIDREGGPGADLREQFPQAAMTEQTTVDAIPTFWVSRRDLIPILQYLKRQHHFEMLFDLCGVDERLREHRDGIPESDFTVVYQLMSFRNRTDIRIKVALDETDCSVPTIISIWPNANWYEREAWDMYGIEFTGHPNLARILLPPTWEGHALRKDHPARATELPPFKMTEVRLEDSEAKSENSG